jgi:phosphohistidine phosphatase
MWAEGYATAPDERLDSRIMDVWILRHAAAQDRAPSGKDEDRELSSEGHARAEAVARGLAALSPSIDVILTSRYPRARQTAEPCANALRLEPPRDSPALLPGTDPSKTVKELVRGGWSSVLLVGHQPHLGSLVGLLAFGDERREIPLRKAAVARVSWELGGEGRLEALLPPKLLERIGKGRAQK